jgi:large subunit ribosomal protein L5
MDKFKYKSVMEVPVLEKIVINMGVGEAVQNPKALESAVGDMTIISGQKPIIRKPNIKISPIKSDDGRRYLLIAPPNCFWITDYTTIL